MVLVFPLLFSCFCFMDTMVLTDIKIRKAEISDYKILAEKHIEVFPDFFMSSLGLSFLRTYYKYVLQHPDTISFFAENGGEVVGYVVGRIRAKGFLKSVIKRNPLPFLWQGIKLIFTRPGALIRIFKNLEKRKDDGDIHDNQDYGEIGLIGINPSLKGKGIGRKLLGKIEEELHRHNVSRLSLTTDYYNNDNTLAAYKAWGFHVLYDFKTYPDRRMYRLIKDVQ